MERHLYYLHYYQPGETYYRLYYLRLTDSSALLPKDAYRITRKNAQALAIQENCRRKRRRPDAFLSDAAIYPGWYDGARERISEDPRFVLKNFIWKELDIADTDGQE